MASRTICAGGLIGALLAAKSARNTLEFYKFASWRFLRCRMAVREPRFGEVLRRICMTVRRKVGEATTVHERNVESAIGRVPQWRGREAAYAPLVGGLMNQNWLVEIAGDPRRYFIKVPGEGSEMFIDRVAANEAARNAHAMGSRRRWSSSMRRMGWKSANFSKAIAPAPTRISAIPRSSPTFSASIAGCMPARSWA